MDFRLPQFRNSVRGIGAVNGCPARFNNSMVEVLDIRLFKPQFVIRGLQGVESGDGELFLNQNVIRIVGREGKDRNAIARKRLDE
jgi:hypothetical protein